MSSQRGPLSLRSGRPRWYAASTVEEEKLRIGKGLWAATTRALAVGLIGLGVVSLACGGGGGGGGGGNPVAPPPPPPAPPPPGAVTGNLQGTVEGFYTPGTNFGGTRVTLVDSGVSTTVDSSNKFGFDNVSSGVQRLEFTGGNHVNRRVRVRIQDGGINRFDGLTLVESAPFDLAAFDEIYRTIDGAAGTVRWRQRPSRVLLDRNSLGDLPQGLSFFETEIKRAYNTWLPNNTGGFFAGTPVNTSSLGDLDPEAFDCSDVPVGQIHIFGVDECPMDEEFVTLGLATHCFNTVGNEVVLGAIFFNPCTDEATIEHEIIHTLCALHLESRPADSIMGSPRSSDDITILPLDRRHMRYLYDRPPGTLSPDDMWGAAPLSSMFSAGGGSLQSITGGDRRSTEFPAIDDDVVLEPSNRPAEKPKRTRDSRRGN